MKKLFSYCAIGVLLACITVQTAKAEVKSATDNDVTFYFTVNDDGTTCTLVNEDNGTSTTSYTATTISIPETLTVDGTSYTVTAIGNYCFYKCTSITSLTIPKTVKVIRSYAVGNSSGYGASGITTLTFAEGCELDSVGNRAFARLTSLTSVTLPAKVGAWGTGVFSNCTTMTTVTIPAGIESLGYQMFYNCSALKTVTFATGTPITAVPDGCFYGCSKLTSIDFLPSGITRIGNSAFYKCTGLTSVNLPTSIEKIGMNAFNGCTNSSFTTLTLPATLTDIGCDAVDGGSTSSYGAFQGCTKLTTLTFADGIKITKIPDKCFREDSLITEVSIPEGVTSIGSYAFAGTYTSGKYSRLTSVTLPSTLTTIGSYAFEYCRKLTGLTLPEALTSIGDYAFYNNIALTEMTIPAAVTSIGDYAFKNCSGIKSFTFADDAQITSLGGGALREMTSLETIELPNTITTCGSSQFYGNTSLRKANIPSQLTTVPQYMFSGCTTLDTLIVPHDTPPSITQKSSGDIAYPFYNGCSPKHVFVPAYSLALYPHQTELDTPSYWFTDSTVYYPYYDLTVSSLGVATLGLPFNAVLPDGVTPYVLTTSSDTEVTGTALSETTYVATTTFTVSSDDDDSDDTETTDDDSEETESSTSVTVNILKKNTPVYVTAEKGTYRFYGYERVVEGLDLDYNSGDNTDYGKDTSGDVETTTRTAELLTAVYNSAAYITASGNAYAPTGSYVLQSHGGRAMFYKVTSDSTIKLGQYRTYLTPTSSDSSDEAKYLSLNLDGGGSDETTGISTVRTATVVDSDAVYNLQGVRMNADNLPAGIYIKGGKKFVK